MTSVLPGPQAQTIRSAERLKIGVAFFAFILIGANDGAFGIILPSIQTHYQVDKSALGLFFLASVLGYFTASFNTGLLMAKLGNRLLLVVSMAIFLLGAGLIGAMLPFFLAPIGYLLLGFGVAMLDAGLNTYITGLPKNTALLNYLHAFYGAGAWLGPIIASAILALQFGWNSIYWLWGAISIILLISFAFIFKTQTVTSKQSTGQLDGNLMVATLRLPAVWLAIAFLFFYVGAEVSVGNWSYSFLTEERHGLALISGWIVSGYWLGLTLGRATLGKVAQMIGNQRMIQACLVGAIVGVLLTWLVPNQIVEGIGLWLCGFSLGPIFPTTIALVSNLVPGRLVPSAIGFLVSLASMGTALLPWLAGNLAQGIGLWTLFPYVILLTLAMLAFWLVLQHKPQATPENGN